MKFLIVEPSPLPILIPLGPKYSPQDYLFTYQRLKIYSSEVDMLVNIKIR